MGVLLAKITKTKHKATKSEDFFHTLRLLCSFHAKPEP
jgi:hypothetical protein